MELILIHLLTHELPLAVVAGVSYFFGKKVVFKYVRKHDPVVQELREAASGVMITLESNKFGFLTNVERLERAIEHCEAGSTDCGDAHRRAHQETP